MGNCVISGFGLKHWWIIGGRLMFTPTAMSVLPLIQKFGTGGYSTGLFAQDVPTLSVGEPGVLLLEVKYDSFLPDIIRDLIQTNVRHTEAFSKYAACRIYG